MSRSPIYDRFTRALRVAYYCHQENIPVDEALGRLKADQAQGLERRLSRREFLADLSKLAAGTAVGMAGQLPVARAFAASGNASVNVGIVGAGLAGLACADELTRNKVPFTLYEASSRVGGRQFSFGINEFFPGQSAERGGEFIDTPHKTLLGYANKFGLAKEDVGKVPGEIYYFFGGARHDEAQIVEELRSAIPALRDDLRVLSAAPTADDHTDADVALDRTSLREYLETRVPGTLARAVIDEAYVAEYGLETARQSCLNFLLFFHLDRRSKFTPFGVSSDERYHIIEGNDRIAKGIRDRLPGPIQYETRLIGVRRRIAGDVELTLAKGGKEFSVVHGAVVIAIPFTVLRGIQMDLDVSVPLEAQKRLAIDQLGYGTNAKQMIQFDGRPWSAQNPVSNGGAYCDLQNCQTTWETNPLLATNGHAILTDYSGGDRGATLNPNAVQTEALRFLTDLDKIYPGALAAATRDSNFAFRAHLEHWPSNPLTKGSYTCYMPGQFTTIAGNEGKPVGNIHFAGEHTNSFYEWQGFMEGAALSGIDAAKQILAKLKKSAL
jgi:monoamine oxidase